ncbi:hypothetical protein [Rhodoplanes roseus]|uniref:Uncharacterized protein n=1 Tax=Rhodoplanes roseus TaxID=29409 RepID=A0A327L5L9_9BRAD|nr:hypothetical protein [Rhodoplanes roseus]RAI45871.1 hypothetical protein CH341_01865 [Rhodoplanes roseus]
MLKLIELRQLKDSLDPKEIESACVAYENALTLLTSADFPVDREQIAQRIVTLARAGITDPDRLCRLALTGLLIRKDQPHAPAKPAEARRSLDS